METVNVASSRSEWLAARLALLEKEKEITHAKDALAAERRKLPMVKVTTDYAFETIDPTTGKETTVRLADLFEGKTQLIVYHYMFKPEWESGCTACTFMADHFPYPEHMQSRDTTLAAVARAAPAQLEEQRRRMGWERVRWYSSGASSFNVDFHVSMDRAQAPVEYNYRDEKEWQERGHGDAFVDGAEMPGISVFYKGKDGEVYHAYSCFGRALDALLTTYQLLDLTPLGRQDTNNPPGPHFKRRDLY